MAWVVGIGIFLFLLFLFPRPVISLIILCAVAGGALFLYYYLGDKRRGSKIAGIDITVNYNIPKCSKDYPLEIRIKNNSGSTINKIRFNLAGYREGFSEPIYGTGYDKYETDKIIPIGKTLWMCWKIPKLSYGKSEAGNTAYPPKSMIWKASDFYPDFAE